MDDLTLAEMLLILIAISFSFQFCLIGFCMNELIKEVKRIAIEIKYNDKSKG